MTYIAHHCANGVFIQPKRRRKSVVVPGRPIPPGGFRRQATSSTVTSKFNNASKTITSTLPSQQGGRSHECPTEMRVASEKTAEEAATERNAESLSQDMSSQLTLTGEHERHPEQCTPGPAAMVMGATGIPQSSSNTQAASSSWDSQREAPAPQRIRLDTPSLFVREDTVEYTSTPSSQLEAQKYQAIVDRLNIKRDQADPDFILPEEAHNNSNLKKSPAGGSKDRNAQAVRGANARPEHVEIEENNISGQRTDGAGTRIGGINSSASNTAGPATNTIAPTCSKRRSPEPDSTTPDKRIKQAGRPRTRVRRYSHLKSDSQAKRMDLLADIQIIWNRRCQDAIPQNLWLREGKEERSPRPPCDWPRNLLEDIKVLAQHTGLQPNWAVAALQQAVVQQTAMYGGGDWLRSRNDVELAVEIVNGSVGGRDTPMEEENRTLSEELLRLNSARPGAIAGASLDQTNRAPPVENRQVVVGQQEQETMTPRRTSASSTAPAAATPIKQESSLSPTGPALITTLTPQAISALCEDKLYTLKLLIEADISRRKSGGRPNMGNLSTLDFADLTAEDLSRLSALDFHKLRKVVETDWERREAIGANWDNAIIVD